MPWAARNFRALANGGRGFNANVRRARETSAAAPGTSAEATELRSGQRTPSRRQPIIQSNKEGTLKMFPEVPQFSHTRN